MGHKKVCLECRVTLNRPFDDGTDQVYLCPECGKPMKLLPHRFRPPKKSEDKKWETVEFLIENGFHFQHIYENIEMKKQNFPSQKYVVYPDNIKQAKEFVEKYKKQAKGLSDNNEN